MCIFLEQGGDKMKRNNDDDHEKQPWSFNKKLSVVVLICIIAGTTAELSIRMIVTIPAGYKGVVLTFGQAVYVLDEGLHFINPISDQVVLMNIMINKVETEESAASQDLQEVTATLAVNYKLELAYVLDTYKNMRNEYEDTVIKPNIEECIKAVTATFKAEELITKRAEVKANVDELLSTRLQQYHIDVISVSITNFAFSTEFNKAIEAKVTAEQRALEAKNKLEQIRYEAQQQVIQAEAYYNATITKARADSEAMLLLKISLSPEYLQYQALLKWDGKLPYLFGGGVLPFIDISTNSTKP